MLNQKPKARRRFNPISSRFGGPILTFASHSGECQIHFPRAYSVLIESERKLQILVLTRFLTRAPVSTPLENALRTVVEMGAQLIDRGKAHHTLGHLGLDRSV